MSGAPRRTAKVANKREFPGHAWTDDCLRVWREAQDLVADAVTLHYPRLDLKVLMLPDAFDAHWGCTFTQPPRFEYCGDVPVEDLTHQPLASLSRSFWCSQVDGAPQVKKGTSSCFRCTI